MQAIQLCESRIFAALPIYSLAEPRAKWTCIQPLRANSTRLEARVERLLLCTSASCRVNIQEKLVIELGNITKWKVAEQWGCSANKKYPEIERAHVRIVTYAGRVWFSESARDGAAGALLRSCWAPAAAGPRPGRLQQNKHDKSYHCYQSIGHLIYGPFFQPFCCMIYTN